MNDTTVKLPESHPNALIDPNDISRQNAPSIPSRSYKLIDGRLYDYRPKTEPPKFIEITNCETGRFELIPTSGIYIGLLCSDDNFTVSLWKHGVNLSPHSFENKDLALNFYNKIKSTLGGNNIVTIEVNDIDKKETKEG